MAAIRPFWPATPPAKWPDFPSEMTVSTLAEIESCPRRWALGAADYPDLWADRGYPPRVNAGALAGTVIHLMLERITRQFALAGCASIADPKTSAILRELGGYSKVAQACVDKVLSECAANPRGATGRGNLGDALRAQIPEIRSRAQAILSRIKLAQLPAGHGGTAPSATRSPLSLGAHAETVLRATPIRWKGRVDLLVLTDTECEISDFKTGARDEAHAFQVQVYALLWYLDEELNPRTRVATRLKLSYVSEDVDVPVPNAAQLKELQQVLVARRESADQAVTVRPPVARPSSENCRYCGVRHLCDEYWSHKTQAALALGASKRFDDAEVLVTGRHGPLSWDVKILLSRRYPSGRKALLRSQVPLEFTTGTRVRVIDAAIAHSADEEEQPAIIGVGQFSEVYIVETENPYE